MSFLPIVIAESIQVVKESDFQPIVITENGQVVEDSASQPNMIAESSKFQHNIRFKGPRVSPPKEFVLFLRKYLSKNITKCQGRCGKSIGNEDEMIIRSYGTSTWTKKVNGKENYKYGPMYLHFNEKCLKNFDNENYYGPGQAFNYSAVTVNLKSQADLNPAEIHLLRKLGILL